MLNAVAAEKAFIVAINSGLPIIEMNKAVSIIAVEFHEFLAATYAQNLPKRAEQYVWDAVWGSALELGDIGYDAMEAHYAAEAAEAHKSYSMARMA